MLGNHDYGDGIASGDPPPACREGEPLWRCSAGPLTQVDKKCAPPQKCTMSPCRPSSVTELPSIKPHMGGGIRLL